jgi:glycosyltransferase involved in cell wall biosynthesis
MSATNQDAATLPLVSFVTPSFNKAKYLEATLKSVLDQDYPNIEYIIMDGGSTDGSLEIIRKYEKRFAYWTSGSDGGGAAAVAAGWSRCRGDILAEVDASDVLAPGAVRRAVESFGEHPDWGMLFSDSAWIDEDGRFLYPVRSREFNIPEMLCGNYIAQPTVFMRRQALEDVGYYRPEFVMSMDFDLWMRMGLKHRIGYLPGEVLGMMRQHEDSKTLFLGGLYLADQLQVIDETLASDAWAPHRRRLRPPAVGCAYARHAANCLRQGQRAEARAALWKMIQAGSLLPWKRYGRDLPSMIVNAFGGQRVASRLHRSWRYFVKPATS